MHVKQSAIASLARWRDVVLYGACGAIVALFIAPIATKRFAPFLQSLLHSANVQVFQALLALAVVATLHSIAGTRLSHLRAALRYPPLPVSVALGVVLIPLVGRILNAPETLTFKQVFIIEGIYAATWLLQVGASLLAEVVSVASTQKNLSKHGSTAEGASLKRWLAREEPIEDTASDMFDHTLVAERLVQKLQAGESTIALQGDFGSGKSSVAAISRTLARQQKLPLIFAQVSCWGFGQSIDAQEELLTGIIRAVNKHVDTFGVRRLPAEYVSAVGHRASWLETLLKLLTGKRSPIHVLQDLSPLLGAVHKRGVVFVEDADRNFPTFDMSQLEGLLVRLREVPGLSFVLCVSPTQKIDLARLCDQTEIVPPLDRAATLRLIHETREMLLKEYPVEIMLDAIHPLLSNDDDYRVLDWHLDYFWPWQLVLHGLAKTPRTLKRALRRLVHAWPALRGEVHIDDLISICVLREGAQNAFAFFSQNYRFFKPAGKDTNDLAPNAKTRLKESLQEEWQEITATKTFDGRSAVWLMKELFPASATITGISGVHTLHRQSMQSDRRGSVYARRLLTESTVGDEISDQRILRLLRDAETDDNALREVAKVITDSKFASDAFEEFASYADFRRFLPLLSEVYKAIQDRCGARLSRDEHPGFFAPWRLVNRNKPAEFEPWLVSELRKCIPNHLRLLTDIYYFWLGTDEHTADERVEARRTILEALQAAWLTMSPTEIPNGFDPGFPYTMFHLFFTSDYEKPVTVPLNKIEDWSWTSGPILNAARARPSIILPQVITVLNSAVNRGNEIPRFKLNRPLLESRFRDSARDILSHVANGFELSPELNAQEHHLIALAIQNAKDVVASYQPDSHTRTDAA
jgi:hypothetical protein